MQNDRRAAQKPIDQFTFGFLHPVAKIFNNTTIQIKLFYKKMNFMPKALWWPTVVESNNSTVKKTNSSRKQKGQFHVILYKNLKDEQLKMRSFISGVINLQQIAPI